MMIEFHTRVEYDLERQVDALQSFAAAVSAGVLSGLRDDEIAVFYEHRSDVYAIFRNMWQCVETRECSWEIARELCGKARDAVEALDSAYPEIAGEARPHTFALDEFHQRCESET